MNVWADIPLAKPPLMRSKRRRHLKKYRKRWRADPAAARRRWNRCRDALLSGVFRTYRGYIIVTIPWKEKSHG